MRASPQNYPEELPASGAGLVPPVLNDVEPAGRYKPCPYSLSREAVAVFTGDDECLDHVRLFEAAAKLVQRAEPELQVYQFRQTTARYELNVVNQHFFRSDLQ